MEYYYAVGGERQGPVSEEELKTLIQTKAVNAETLIWHAGLKDWKRLAEVAAKNPALSGAEPVSGAPARQGVCLECGKAHPVQEMIQYRDSWVCAACKPVSSATTPFRCSSA